MAARRTPKQELEHVVEFCREHFPHGAPPHAAELKLASVSCEHGTYPVDAAVPAAAPAKDPEGEQEHDGNEDDEDREQA